MRLGIIILFDGDNEEVNQDNMLDYYENSRDLEICLVNNNDVLCSSMHISSYLLNIKNLYVLNIRKSKLDTSAVRAGARFMYSRFQYEHLGHISCSSFDEVLQVIKMVLTNKGAIIKWSQSRNRGASRKRTQFQSIFSLSQFWLAENIDYQLG
jgi:hypothetical protein